MAACNHHWPLRHPSSSLEHWCVRGILWDQRSRPGKSHHLPGALLPRWLQTVYRVSSEGPQIQLYRESIYFHNLWLYFENTLKKACYLSKYICTYIQSISLYVVWNTRKYNYFHILWLYFVECSRKSVIWRNLSLWTNRQHCNKSFEKPQKRMLIWCK